MSGIVTRVVLLAAALCGCAPCAEASTRDAGASDAEPDGPAARLSCDAPECSDDLSCCADEHGQYCCDYVSWFDGGYSCHRGEPECVNGTYCCVVGPQLFGYHCVDFWRNIYCDTVGGHCQGLSRERREACIAYWAERIPWYATDGGVRPDGGSR